MTNVGPLLKHFFHWEKSVQLDPTQLLEDSAQDSGTAKWTRFFKARENPTDNESLLYHPIVSIRKSEVEGAGYGLFSEREFRPPHDIISVYLGSVIDKSKATMSNYSVKIKHKDGLDVYIDVKPNLLNLGAHISNDINWTFPGEPAKKRTKPGKRGKTMLYLKVH